MKNYDGTITNSLNGGTSKMEKLCERCQSTFEAKRSDALYCSRTCRQYAYLDNRVGKINGYTLPVAGLIGEGLTSQVEQEPYKPQHSVFIDSMGDIDSGDDILGLRGCMDSTDDDPNYWVGRRLRCLIECILFYSEAKAVSVYDLMELCDAYTRLLNTHQYKQLSYYFPYTELIVDHRERLFRICKNYASRDSISFRVKMEEKSELVRARYLLASYVIKMSFCELDF